MAGIDGSKHFTNTFNPHKRMLPFHTSGMKRPLSETYFQASMQTPQDIVSKLGGKTMFIQTLIFIPVISYSEEA